MSDLRPIHKVWITCGLYTCCGLPATYTHAWSVAEGEIEVGGGAGDGRAGPQPSLGEEPEGEMVGGVCWGVGTYFSGLG